MHTTLFLSSPKIGGFKVLLNTLCLFLFAFAAHAQHVYIADQLPRPVMPVIQIKPPAHCKQMIQFTDRINGTKTQTDTIQISRYNKNDSLSTEIRFGLSTGKRENQYFYEYPDPETTKWSSKVKAGSFYNYEAHENRKDKLGNLLSGKDYIVTEKHDTTITNTHEFQYNPQNQLIYQCDLCNTQNPIKRYFFYKNDLLVRMVETKRDTTLQRAECIIHRDEHGKIIRYEHTEYNGTAITLMTDRKYEYNDKILVKESQFNYFEPSVLRVFSYSYDNLGRIEKQVSSIANDSTVVTYSYEDNRIIKETTSTTFPLLSDTQIWFSATAKKYDGIPVHTIEKRYLYNSKHELYGFESSTDGVLKSRSHTSFK
jgi:hypothetical protein